MERTPDLPLLDDRSLEDLMIALTRCRTKDGRHINLSPEMVFRKQFLDQLPKVEAGAFH